MRSAGACCSARTAGALRSTLAIAWARARTPPARNLPDRVVELQAKWVEHGGHAVGEVTSGVRAVGELDRRLLRQHRLVDEDRGYVLVDHPVGRILRAQL